MSRSIRRAPLPDVGYQGHAIVDGIPLATMPKPSAGEAALALAECDAGTQIWGTHAQQLASLLDRVERALDLHMPYPPGDEDVDPVFLTECVLRGHLHSVDMAGGDPSAPGVSTLGRNLAIGDDAIECLIRGRLEALHTSAHLLKEVAPEIDLLAADHRAAALHRHPAWSALLRKRRALVTVLAVVSRQLSTDTVRITGAAVDPETGDGSIEVVIKPDATPAEVAAQARWFSRSQAAQAMYRNAPAMVTEAIAPAAPRGSIH